jgi:hypothetical protein
MGIIRLILVRKLNPNETLGTYIVIDDYTKLYQCCCIELPWLNNERDKSCIPSGEYAVEKYNTTDHPNSFHILDVPDRDGILIHIGNFATGKQVDTLGCQCPGLSFADIDGNGTLDVSASTPAMAALNHFLPDKFNLYILD